MQYVVRALTGLESRRAYPMNHASRCIALFKAIEHVSCNFSIHYAVLRPRCLGFSWVLVSLYHYSMPLPNRVPMLQNAVCSFPDESIAFMYVEGSSLSMPLMSCPRV